MENTNIIFRAWIPTLKGGYMSYFDNLLFNGECSRLDVIGDGEYEIGSKAIPMLKIGQKDKNGKDVFDGDIVKVGGLTEVVQYKDGILLCYNPKTHGTPDKITVDNYEDYIVTESDYFEPYEVIGNIYEDKELLSA